MRGEWQYLLIHGHRAQQLRIVQILESVLSCLSAWSEPILEGNPKNSSSLFLGSERLRATMIAKPLLMLGLLGLTLGAEDLRNTMMDRQSLHEYSLAKCSDGSAAAYYIDKVSTLSYLLFSIDWCDRNRQTVYGYLFIDSCLVAV